MAENVLVKLILATIENTPTIATITEAAMPPATHTALNAWASQNNILLDNGDTDAEFHKVSFKVLTPDTYVASYSGDNPDQFLAVAVLQNDKIIGESVEVAS